MITTTLIYDRRKKATENKKGMVEIRIILNRKSYYISTGVRVLPKKWKNGFVINMPDADDLNRRLYALMSRANDAANKQLEEGKPINLDSIKKYVMAAVSSDKADNTDMLEWLKKQIKGLRLAPDTLKHYNTLELRLIEYNRLTKWSDLTLENLYSWDAWLHELPSGRNKTGKLSDSAVWNYHKTMKALLNRAVMFEKIDRNPYDRLRGKFKRGDNENTEYLTETEVQKLIKLKYKAGTELGKARDLFIFQAYTGLSYGDTQVFDIDEYKEVNGRWVNNGERIKTGVAYVSELLPPAVDVLKRNGMKVPKVSNQAYNRALKVVGEAASISTPLHSHLARHTFATMMLRMGAKIENVSRMLGHTNIKQTQRYAKVLAESVHDDFEMVREKMTKKKK